MPSRLRLEQEEPRSTNTITPANEATAAGGPRYDAETQQKIIALASRLQQERDQTLTAEQLAAAGSEVGLEPAFVREAVARLDAAQERETLPRPITARTTTQATVRRRQRSERAAVLPAKHIRSRLIGLAWAVFFGVFFGEANRDPVSALVVPGLAAVTAWQGGVLGGKRSGFWAGAALVFVMLFVARAVGFPFMPDFAPLVLLMAAGGLTGALGAFVAQKRAPQREAEEETVADAVPGEMNRAALLDQMFALQRQLAGQKRRAAFLSVDVVGSSQIKQAARTTGDELAVKHAFGQYHRWVEGIVATHGGRVQAAAGDGVMCLFEAGTGENAAAPEARAIRAARDLQTRLAAFNASQGSHLSAPLRIRCGVSAGEVAIEAGAPVGHLQSVVIDRAAALQKRAAPGDIVVDEASAVAALTELGALGPLNAEGSNGDAPAFSWRAAADPEPGGATGTQGKRSGL